MLYVVLIYKCYHALQWHWTSTIEHGLKSHIKVLIRWEPWSSGYGRRLMFQRLWVQIPAPYNGFTFICCINYSVCLKRRKWGRSSPIFSKKYRSDHQLWQKSFKLPVPAGDATVNVTNVKGTSALHLASENGHPEIVDILLKSGSVITASDNKGNSALHYAASNGHLDIVRMLVEIGGSDVEA